MTKPNKTLLIAVAALLIASAYPAYILWNIFAGHFLVESYLNPPKIERGYVDINSVNLSNNELEGIRTVGGGNDFNYYFKTVRVPTVYTVYANNTTISYWIDKISKSRFFVTASTDGKELWKDVIDNKTNIVYIVFERTSENSMLENNSKEHWRNVTEFYLNKGNYEEDINNLKKNLNAGQSVLCGSGSNKPLYNGSEFYSYIGFVGCVFDNKELGL